MYRLGYACINMAADTLVNKSCVAKTYRQKGAEYAIELARLNLCGVLENLKWNQHHGIKFYRLSSDMFPHITNPEFCEGQMYAYSLEQFIPELKLISEYAKKHKHRLTFHPSQFNQVGAQSQSVFEKTCTDLKFHADILDLLDCGPESVLVVHGGGTYNNKAETMKRWIQQFHNLPTQVQDRLVIENCEFQYNYLDILELAKNTHRPMVFDTHHHDCYYLNKNQAIPDPKLFIKDVMKTWGQVRPKVHVSNQDPAKRLGAHSYYVDSIPEYLRKLDIDIMIEAKGKEQAVLKLYDKYFNLANGENGECIWTIK